MPGERWLQTVWGRTDWCGWSLETTTDQPLRVLSPGQWNPNQGPDFLQAQIFIGQILWVGSVELHVRSSDWFRHRHPSDPNYQDVILHVVWEVDRLQPDLPTLELSKYINRRITRQQLLQLVDIGQLACHRFMRPIDSMYWTQWRSELLQQRIKKKGERIQEHHNYPLRTVLARQLGAWVNRDVFEYIDSSIPDALFEWAAADLHRITALYLGQGGFLSAANSAGYLNTLSVLYRNIQLAYPIYPPHKQLLWMRIRPAASPLLRLTQLAFLYHAGWMDPAKWLASDPLGLRSSLRSIILPDHWQEMYGAYAPLVHRSLFSEGMVDGLLINIWAYLNAPDLASTLARLQQLPLEDNRVTRMFSDMRMEDLTAADSQAMLELHQVYCSPQRCNSCRLARCWVQDQAPQSI